MSNFNINNTLAELEDNLKKMDSARTQVSNLSQLVRQLTEAYSDTLGQLKKIESSIHYDEKYFEKKFGKSINELDANINLLQSKVVDHNNSVSSIQEKASKDFINSLKKSEDKVKLYIEEFKPALEKVQNDFKNKNEEIIVDLQKKINEVIDTSSDKIAEIKGLDLLKEIYSIESTTKEINSNFESILSQNNEFKTQLEDLKKSQMDQSNKLESKINIVLILVIVILICSFILKFV